MKIILLGPPGSGKGTQAELLEKQLKIKKISPGDILRTEINNNTQIGIKIKKIQNNGMLINDTIIINLIKKYIQNETKIILDGFPRTLDQANFLLKNKIYINYLINIDIKNENIIKRLKYRLINNKSKKIYNIIYKKPKIKNKDDINGKTLTLRSDDKYQTIITRLLTYNTNTKKIIYHYKKQTKTKIININGNKNITHIFNSIKKNIL